MPWKSKIENVEWTQRTKKSVFVRSKSCYFHSCDMINLFNFVYADIIQTHTLSPARVHTQGRQMYSWKNKKIRNIVLYHNQIYKIQRYSVHKCQTIRNEYVCFHYQKKGTNFFSTFYMNPQSEMKIKFQWLIPNIHCWH